MVEEKFVYNKTYIDYGKIVLTIDDMLKKRNMKAYRLSVLTGINWGIIEKYAKGNLYRVDLDLLAKMCYALDCSLDDLIHYEKAKIKEKQTIVMK